jgi:hypothetical protein
MQPDDEIVLGRALDESRDSLRLIESLQAALHRDGLERFNRTADLNVTAAEFELHGATLHRLADWYPNEAQVQRAVQEWERLRSSLEEQ